MSKTNINSLYYFQIITLFILPIGFLIRTFYSRTLTPLEFGIIYSMIAFFGFLSVLVNFGFSSSLIYFIPQYSLKKDYETIKNLFYYSFISQFILILLFSLLIYIFAIKLSIYYFHSELVIFYIKIFLIYFIFLNLFKTLADIFISYKMGVYYQSLHFFQLLLIFIFSTYFYYSNNSNISYYYALSWGLSCFTIFLIYSFILFYKFKYLFAKPKFDKKLYLKFLHYSFYLFLNNIGLNFLLQIDILLITYLSTFENVGIYSNSYALVNIFMAFISSLSTFFIPIFSELKEKKDYVQLTFFLDFLYGMAFYIILPISLVFFLFPIEFLNLFYGSNYTLGKNILIILSLFSIFKIIGDYNLAFFVGLGIGKKLTKIIFITLVLNLILSICFFQFMGIIGIAVSTIISWLYLTFSTSTVLFRELHYKYDFIKALKIIFLGVIFVLFIFLFKNIIFIYNYYLTYFIVLMVSFLLYLIFGYLLKIYTIKEMYILVPVGLKTKIEKIHKKYFNFLK